MKTITKIFTKALVLFAISDIIFILTLINTKLLMFLNWYKIGHNLDNYFALISGIAYALGSISVVIWYNPPKRNKKEYIGSILLKLSFVILDGIYVYIYQNLILSEDLIPKVASGVFAVQTILILYFIGKVTDKILKNNTENESEFEKYESQINSLQTNLTDTQSKLEKKRREFKSLLTDFRKTRSEFEENKSQIKDSFSKVEKYSTEIARLKHELGLKQTDYDNMKSQFEFISKKLIKSNNEIIDKEKSIKQKNEHIKMLEAYYFRSEKSRILKKKAENRTEKENKILSEAENY